MNTLRFIRFVVLLVAAAACGPGPSTAPCTSCADVAGTYAEAVDGASATTMCDATVHWVTYDDSVLVKQNAAEKSRLTATFVEGGTTLYTMTGVLHDDGTASFDAVPYDAETSEGEPVPGRLSLMGSFTTSPVAFSGRYYFLENADNCASNAPTSWETASR